MLSILVGDEGFLKFSYEMCYGQSGRVDIIFFCVEMPLKCFKILIKKNRSSLARTDTGTPAPGEPHRHTSTPSDQVDDNRCENLSFRYDPNILFHYRLFQSYKLNNLVYLPVHPMRSATSRHSFLTCEW